MIIGVERLVHCMIETCEEGQRSQIVGSWRHNSAALSVAGMLGKIDQILFCLVAGVNILWEHFLFQYLRYADPRNTSSFFSDLFVTSLPITWIAFNQIENYEIGRHLKTAS